MVRSFLLLAFQTTLSRSLKMRQKMMNTSTMIPRPKAVRHTPLSLGNSTLQISTKGMQSYVVAINALLLLARIPHSSSTAR